MTEEEIYKYYSNKNPNKDLINSKTMYLFT